ncbi:dioxygenase [Kaistella flava (ex Peng et al. 2021)]|uniref:Dioxygenase n=1 Tax=Kaistella flava (ex Peng et al. 2021) TaxID=2038776 RepID=A0A7M2Y5V2_9FLAO|nr:VOC family protein [Kaistella flava (ex Peng et al. 2021)]QOW09466.1 dioxygenase [Kaistella flava (ex Peng et al. 2021)]
MNAFHYAFKVKDIESTRRFYVDILECEEGRSTENWIDFNFFGNQLSAHISTNFPEPDYCGNVDGVKVPIPHFGCLLEKDQFEKIYEKFEREKVNFILKPQKRYEGKVGEQMTMFVQDFSGNFLEFKSFSDKDEIFS